MPLSASVILAPVIPIVVPSGTAARPERRPSPTPAADRLWPFAQINL